MIEPSRQVTRARAAMADPGAQALAVLAVLAVGGFVLLALGWQGTDGVTFVPFQTPWLVSAGVGGLAMLGMALGAASIHLGRRDDAAHRARVEALVREAAELAERMGTTRGRGYSDTTGTRTGSRGS
ncbi:MAG: hypothetical protein QOD30_2243 [Actinomycetota bacterium]|jgi:hypothetical protein|nr:hypothetical protein [Actinomycetota bacterium]